MLKAEGFRKAGHTFRAATPRCVLVVNVQASQGSSREAVKFTVNLGAFYPELNEVMQVGSWASPGASGPTEVHCQLQARLGDLMPGHGDVWWELRSGSPSVAVASEVREALRGYRLPWLRAMVDLEAACHQAEKCGNVMEAAGLAILAGKRDEARKLLADFLSERPHDMATRVWARQLGLLEP